MRVTGVERHHPPPTYPLFETGEVFLSTQTDRSDGLLDHGAVSPGQETAGHALREVFLLQAGTGLAQGNVSRALHSVETGGVTGATSLRSGTTSRIVGSIIGALRP